MAVIRSDAREIVYSGAYGAGKSITALVWALRAAMRSPRAHVLLFRKHLVDLKSTLLMALERGSGKIPPLLFPGMYAHNQSRRLIQLQNGGTIEYNGLDNQSGARVVGRNATAAVVDQAEELTEDDFVAINSRIRAVVDEVPRQLLLVCNPSAPSHWIAKRYGLAGSAPQCEYRFDAIRTASSDNTYLPDDQIRFLNSLTGVTHKRYVLGEWCGSEGAVYDNFRREVHVVDRPRNAFESVYIGLDDGMNNPYALIQVGVDGYGRIHVLKELEQRALSEREKVEHAQRFGAGKVSPVIADPSAAAIKEALRRTGATVHNGINDKRTGIAAVHTLFSSEIEGLPAITIDPACKRLIEEVEGYEWDEGKEEPIKVNDHLLDALRYAIMHVRRPDGAMVRREEVAKSSSVARDAEWWDIGMPSVHAETWVKGFLSLGIRWSSAGGWRVCSDTPVGTPCIGLCVPTGAGTGMAYAHAYDAGTRETIGTLAMPGDNPEQVAEAMLGLVHRWRIHKPVVAIKRDGSGREVIATLKRAKMPGLWADDDGQAGWYFGNDRQGAQFAYLRAGIRENRVKEKSLEVLEEMQHWVPYQGGAVWARSKVSQISPDVVSDPVTAAMLAYMLVRLQGGREPEKDIIFRGP